MIAEELRDVARDNPRVRRPVFHASLSLPEGERLSDEQWHRAGEMFVDRMGFRDGEREAPWAIVRHDDEGRHTWSGSLGSSSSMDKRFQAGRT